MLFSIPEMPSSVISYFIFQDPAISSDLFKKLFGCATELRDSDAFRSQITVLPNE